MKAVGYRVSEEVAVSSSPDSLGARSLRERATYMLTSKFQHLGVLFFHGWLVNHKEQQKLLDFKYDLFDEKKEKR